jgi:low temperature requirement protein LtrA
MGWYVVVIHMPETYLIPGFVVMGGCELLVPYVAAKSRSGRAHLSHIVERYGLLTIIVLGECLLASANSFKALAADFSMELLLVAVSSLLISACMWWLYFERSGCFATRANRVSFTWAYGHFFIFASVALVGVGMAVVTDKITGHADIGLDVAVATVAVPVALYLISLWAVHSFPRKGHRLHPQIPMVAPVVLAAPFAPHGVPVVGVILALLVATNLQSKNVESESAL